VVSGLLKISLFKYNLKVHYRLHKSPSLSLVVNQMNKFYTFFFLTDYISSLFLPSNLNIVFFKGFRFPDSKLSKLSYLPYVLELSLSITLKC